MHEYPPTPIPNPRVERTYMYNEGVVYGRRKVGGWEVQWEHSSCISQRKISGRIERGKWEGRWGNRAKSGTKKKGNRRCIYV